MSGVAIVLVMGFVGWAASSAGLENPIVASFKEYLVRNFQSYKTDRRERLTKLGGGWVKEYYEPSAEYSIDVRKTDSLVSPYVGVCEFSLTRHYTDFHEDKAGALRDDNFIKSDALKHKHTYAFQEGRWVPQSRQNFDELLKQWFDCNEVPSSGDNKGQTDIYGCWEKEEANHK